MKKILVIEDEKPILELVQKALIRSGYKVVIAENAREGIRRFNDDGYHLVLTDMVMPGMNGDKVVQHIRSSKKHHTPIIGMSGTPWLFEGTGVDSVISKPFSLKTLLDTVQCLVSSTRKPSVEESFFQNDFQRHEFKSHAFDTMAINCVYGIYI